MAASTTPGLLSRHKELEDKVASLMERLEVPGVAIGIYRDGEEDYLFRGVTSIDNPLEVNSSTLWQIGSTTKTYTATALMILVEQGKVSLDDPVRKHIPELRLEDESVAEKVALRHLLNHTGGWLGDVFTDTGDGDDYLEKYVAELDRVPQMNPLGKFASYNNAAFVVAGLVIQRVTGKRYEDAVRELVLEPLGLNDSFLFPREVMTRRFVVGHGERDGQQKVLSPWALPRSANPPGGIISTAADQVTYARFHLGDGTSRDGRRILSQESVKQMQEPTAELRGGALGDHVGISWLLRRVGGARVVAHGGTTNGQLSAFEMVPSHNFAITVLTNSDKGSALYREVVEWALEHYLGLKDAAEEPVKLEGGALESLLGEYDNRTSIITVSQDGERLRLMARYTEEGIKMAISVLGENPPEPEPILVSPLSRDRYVVAEGDAKGMKGTFIRDETGKVTGIEVGGRIAIRTS